MRTAVSYKCGWGSDKTNPHPNLPQLGKECACVAQLTYSPRPIGKREQLFLNRQAKVTDAGEGLNINRTITHPSLPSYREGTRAVAQLAHSRRIVNFCNNFSKKPKVFAQFCRNT